MRTLSNSYDVLLKSREMMWWLSFTQCLWGLLRNDYFFGTGLATRMQNWHSCANWFIVKHGDVHSWEISAMMLGAVWEKRAREADGWILESKSPLYILQFHTCRATFLRRSHSFCRESFSCFLFSIFWAYSSAADVFPYWILSCKLRKQGGVTKLSNLSKPTFAYLSFCYQLDRSPGFHYFSLPVLPYCLLWGYSLPYQALFSSFFSSPAPEPPCYHCTHKAAFYWVWSLVYWSQYCLLWIAALSWVSGRDLSHQLLPDYLN